MLKTNGIKILPAFLGLLFFAACVFAQSSTASLSGTVTDENNAVVPAAAVKVTNMEMGFERTVTTGNDGTFIIPLLPPGTYTATIERTGFAPVSIRNIVLNVNDRRALNVKLKVGQIGETVIVEGGLPLIESESASVSTLVDRQLIENLPLNGRSFHTLIELTPGVVLTKTEFGSPGQFSVNGQRPSSNYFTVDGVSANTAVSPGNSPNQHAAGSLPSFTAFGGTNNLVSVDAMEEFRIQTSTFAPEFGRTPGAQVSIVTRSGTNDFHGTLFEYFRNDALDANDWFANSQGLPKPALRQNDFGGVLGGPLVLPRLGKGGKPYWIGRDRTFFFFSYEGLRLRQPQFQLTEVPSVGARQNAPEATRRLLNVFPLPNGQNLGNDTAQLAVGYSVPAWLDAASIRIDHKFSDQLNVFGRYNYAVSGNKLRPFGRPFNQDTLRLKDQTFTGAAIWSVNQYITNDFRANWTKSSALSTLDLVEVNGSHPVSASELLPSFAPAGNSLFAAFIGSMGFIVGQNVANQQRQLQFIDTLSVIAGDHNLKFGVDFRRLTPHFGIRQYDQFVIYPNVAAVVANNPPTFQILSYDTLNYVYKNFSLFGQDTWKASRRLTMTYGIRWDVNSPPTADKPFYPIVGLENPATMTLGGPSDSPFKTSYGNFAPRFGAAYKLSQKWGTYLRGGIGLFYDLGTFSSGAIGMHRFPYTRSRIITGQLYPLNPALAAPLPLALNPPYGIMSAYYSNLKSPYTIQWNLAVEQSLGKNQTISATYVAALGRRLIRQNWLRNPNPNFTTVLAIGNGSSSDYHAMQLQFQRRLSRGFQALASYTWSHSIDDNSLDNSLLAPVTVIAPGNQRGPSDFDVRHAFSAATTYDIPAATGNKFLQPLIRNWGVDVIARARSATPLNITTGRDILGVGVSSTSRPDLLQEVPVWIDDPSTGGGRRINPNAFSIPVGRQGNLGRNALRGFPVWQVDLSARRRFSLTEQLKLEFRTDFFNVFNHPNFGDPIVNLRNSLFGRSTQMFGRSLGSGGSQGGFNPLYQIGGPRSIQFSLKLKF